MIAYLYKKNYAALAINLIDDKRGIPYVIDKKT